MRISLLVQALAVSFLFNLSPCLGDRVYLWTDEQGVAHISDQAPPRDVDAKSLSIERVHPEIGPGGAKDQQAASQPMESDSKTKGQFGLSDSTPADNVRKEVQQAPKPKYRDEASLSRDEKIQLLLLEADKEHASKLHSTSSSEEERRRWKAELDKIRAEEKRILEVGNK
jgi:hypothetical protein